MSDTLSNERSGIMCSGKSEGFDASYTEKSVLVIGAANADIHGAPIASQLIPRDSNPGRISVSPGGVGRNIAADLACCAGLRVSMLTAFGDDAFADVIRGSLTERGIDCSLSLTVPGRSSSLYLYISDGSGDMAAAISDMDVVNFITPEYLDRRLDRINSFDAVVADTNLSREALEFLCTRCRKPLYVDPVSVTKSDKLSGLLSGITCIKPNLIEAQRLTGQTEAWKCALALYEAGVRHPFVSCGLEGIVTVEGSGSSSDSNGMTGENTYDGSDRSDRSAACKVIRIPSEPVNGTDAVDATGAGDAAMAALVAAGLKGCSVREAAELAVRTGAEAVRTRGAALPAGFRLELP